MITDPSVWDFKDMDHNCMISLKYLWNPQGNVNLYLQDTNKQEDDDSQNQQVATQPLRED